MRPTTILVADDDPTLHRYLGAIFAPQPTLSIVGNAFTADDAITMAKRLQPDIALVDVEMPGQGTTAAAGILAVSPNTRVVALTAHDDTAHVLGMVISGASGYVIKDTDALELASIVRKVAQGHIEIPGNIVSEVLKQAAEILSRKEREEIEHLKLRERVVEATRGEAVTSVFQPVVELETGRAVAYEALTRFDLEPLDPPDVWFERAAVVGLLEELEAVALDRALGYFAVLPDDVIVSINVSPAAITSERCRALLANAPLDRTILEITEHAPVEEYGILQESLTALRRSGMKLAIDDAGAGFASLKHILLVEPDIIKLDVGLTRDIHLDVRKKALAEALISFATSTDTTIVAEGIENEDEMAALQALGVRFGQGYHLGRPQPWEFYAQG